MNSDYPRGIQTLINSLGYTSAMTRTMSAQERKNLDTQLESIKAGIIRLGTKGRYGAYMETRKEIERLYSKIGKTYNNEDKLHRA